VILPFMNRNGTVVT